MTDANKLHPLAFPAPSSHVARGGAEAAMIAEELHQEANPLGAVDPSARAMQLFNLLNAESHTEAGVKQMEAAVPEILKAVQDILAKMEGPVEYAERLKAANAEVPEGSGGAVYMPYMAYAGLALIAASFGSMADDENIITRYALMAEFMRHYAIAGAAAVCSMNDLPPDSAFKLKGLRCLVDPPNLAIVAGVVKARAEVVQQAKDRGVPVQQHVAELRAQIKAEAGVTDRKRKLPGEPDDDEGTPSMTMAF